MSVHLTAYRTQHSREERRWDEWMWERQSGISILMREWWRGEGERERGVKKMVWHTKASSFYSRKMSADFVLMHWQNPSLPSPTRVCIPFPSLPFPIARMTQALQNSTWDSVQVPTLEICKGLQGFGLLSTLIIAVLPCWKAFSGRLSLKEERKKKTKSMKQKLNLSLTCVKSSIQRNIATQN